MQPMWLYILSDKPLQNTFKKTSQVLRMLSLSLLIQGSLWMMRLSFSIARNVISALCSYPLKLGSPKFLKVKAQFSLNFVPNFKISVLTGKKLYKIWGKNIFFEYLSKMCHLKAKNLLLVSGKPQILHRRKLCHA